ncbi:MAG: metal ABC transporter permease [Nitrospirota bacterium]
MELFSFLKYEFVQRAIIAGSFIALVCSILGVLLVLRGLSLIGDGLAHVTFGGVAIGLLLEQQPVYTAIPVVVLSSLGILKIIEKTKLYGDAAIGIVSSLGIAGGVLIASIAGGFNVDIFSFLFGNILAISKTEVLTSIVLSLVVLLMITLFYHEHLSTAFDEEFARASGINTRSINSLLVILTGITVVLTMKVVGIMLTSSLLILPAVTGFQIARSFKSSMVTSAIFAVTAVLTGTSLSVILNFPTGACIVMMNFIFFLVGSFYRNAVLKR